MIQKRFALQLLVRIVLMLGTMVFLSRILGNSTLVFNQVTAALLLVAQVAELIRFVNQTNRALTRFFQSIQHGDFSTTFFIGEKGNSFRHLEESMTQILQAYKKVKAEKEAQYQFLQILVNQLPIGIITLEDREIILINTAAERLLTLEGFKNWDLVRAHRAALAAEIDSLGDRGRKLVELETNAAATQLSLDVTTSTIQDKPYKLITIQDIHSEIEQKELEAWHKLIRILTHEIMNSVTPIASLTETLQGMLTDRQGTLKPSLAPDIIGDVHFSLQTIYKRSEGLQQFVEHYRTLTRVPKPVKETVALKTFLRHLATLMEGELQRHQIQLSYSVTPDTLRGYFDPKLIEQVIINLIGNSIHALGQTEGKTLQLTASIADRHLVLEVSDNGQGITEKEMKDIFIPFFSTKKEGSGIGLSLSKQIMSLHGGSIRAASQPGKKTTFTLRFPVE